MGKMYIKQQIVQENPELVLSENGDFIIDKSLVDKYEIIDVHCHLFKGLAHLFPAIFLLCLLAAGSAGAACFLHPPCG